MDEVKYIQIEPVTALQYFVESYWMLENESKEDRPIIILPDGRIDLSISLSDPGTVVLHGLETTPSQAILAAGSKMFAVSLRLPALEFMFRERTTIHPDEAYLIPAETLGLAIDESTEFDEFVSQVSAILGNRLTTDKDLRKEILFRMLYDRQGDITVSELSAQCFWSSRQINRYFNDWFGMSLKAYCSILRFRASFPDIKAGKLFPADHFTDQAHFIKNVKRFAGVTPKQLNQNSNGRFIQFSLLPKK